MMAASAEDIVVLPAATTPVIKPKKRDAKKGFGTLGQPIKLSANHYRVTTAEGPQDFFYRYDVEIVLEKLESKKGGGDAKKFGGGAAGVKRELPKALKRKIMNIFVKKNQKAGSLFEGIIPVYDGQKQLYTMKELKMKGKDGVEEIVDVPADADGSARKVTVGVKPCEPHRVAWKAFYDAMLPNSQVESAKVMQVIQCINTVMREAALATATNIAINRSFFTREMGAPSYMGAGREIWSGFYSSVRPCQWKLTLNLDKANTVFYKRMPVLHFLDEFLNLRGGPLKTDSQRKDFEREIKGLKVETTYNGTRRQRVTGVTRDSAVNSKFDNNGTQTNVAAYFMTQFKLKLKHPELPCLKIGSKGSMIPLEVATLLEQKVDKRLTSTQTQAMVRQCTQTAPERKMAVEKIRKESKIVDYDNNIFLKEFKINIGKEMVKMDGRILPLPAIKSAKGVFVDAKNGTWDPRNEHFEKAIKLEHWAVVSTVDTKFVEVEYFIKELVKMGRMERYAAVKKAGDVGTGPGTGVVTQVVLGKTIQKNTERGMLQLVSNLLLKMNGKLGGTNSHVANFQTGTQAPKTNPAMVVHLKRFLSVPTIIFGADVTHPSPGESTDKPSIAAVVASHNRSFTAYAARVRAQKHGQEIMADLRDMVKELLVEFRCRNNQTKPQQIIFYRDGVSEGQFEQVLMAELNAVQEACRLLEKEGSYTPSITYVIVGKRHHTRLFCVNKGQEIGKGLNVPPGTITDRDICHYSEMDWFLCSHGGIQGTSRPAHYNVLYDDSDFSADEIQLFSYFLTFCYARCNRSVSIPAPAYYAHHVAFRARHHLSDIGGAESSSQASTVGHGQSPVVDMAAINRKIKVDENLNGMYFV